MVNSNPRLVTGIVTRHEPYGFYVDFGDSREGLVVITMINDDHRQSASGFPAIGAAVDAVLLGYTERGAEPRLSTRPSDISTTGPGGDTDGNS